MKKTIITLTTALLLLCAPAHAEETTGRVYWFKDGDSFMLDIRRGGRWVEDECRMLHYNTPEMKGKERPLGIVSRRKLMDLMAGRFVHLWWEKRDKYGRMLCEIWLDEGTYINAAMRRWLDEDLRYEGAGKYDHLER